MAPLKKQLKKGKFKPTKRETDMDVMKKRQGIPLVKCNAALTMQYAFLSRAFQPRQSDMLKQL